MCGAKVLFTNILIYKLKASSTGTVVGVLFSWIGGIGALTVALVKLFDNSSNTKDQSRIDSRSNGYVPASIVKARRLVQDADDGKLIRLLRDEDFRPFNKTKIRSLVSGAARSRVYPPHWYVLVAIPDGDNPKLAVDSVVDVKQTKPGIKQDTVLGRLWRVAWHERPHTHNAILSMEFIALLCTHGN